MEVITKYGVEIAGQWTSYLITLI